MKLLSSKQFSSTSKHPIIKLNTKF